MEALCLFAKTNFEAMKNIKEAYQKEATAAFAGDSIEGIWELQINDHNKQVAY